MEYGTGWYRHLVDVAEALRLCVLRVAVVEVEHELPRPPATRPGRRAGLLGDLGGLNVLVGGGHDWVTEEEKEKAKWEKKV